MRRVAHAPTVTAGLMWAPETLLISSTTPATAKSITNGLPCPAITAAANRNVPTNSAASARHSCGERSAPSTC